MMRLQVEYIFFMEMTTIDWIAAESIQKAGEILIT